MPRSQVSPAPRTPSPQTAGQSGSMLLEAPAGQQPSPATGWVMVLRRQTAEQVFAEMKRATTHGSVETQSAADGQAPGWPGAMPVSQVSPGSTTPSPQVGEQSLSMAGVAPAGQQP